MNDVYVPLSIPAGVLLLNNDVPQPIYHDCAVRCTKSNTITYSLLHVYCHVRPTCADNVFTMRTLHRVLTVACNCSVHDAHRKQPNCILKQNGRP